MAPSMVANFLRCTVSPVIMLGQMLTVSSFTSSPSVISVTRTMSVNFINRQNPNHPSGSTAISPLSNITWPQYTLDSRKILLFSDNATEEYTTIPDTYRADGIAAITEVQEALEV